MDTLVARYTSSPFDREAFSDEDQQDFTQSIPSLSLRFALPPVPRVCYNHACPFSISLLTLPSQPSAFLRATTDDHANPNCPIKLAHGTTTLAFRFQGGIIVATDSRATAGNWIASQTVKKVIEINSTLLGTMAGGAAVRTPALHCHILLSHPFANTRATGLPVLACIPRHPMSLTRTATQTSHIRCRSL